MSTNQGLSWLSKGPSLEYGATSVHVDGNDRILLGEFKKIHFSTDFGSTWTATTLYTAASQIYSIATKPNNLVFAGTYHNGVFRSTDNGSSFNFCGIPSGQVFALLVDNLGYIYAGCSSNLYRSTDDGLTWDVSNQGMGVATVRDLKLFNQDTILAGTSSGFYFSADQGNSWNQLNNGLPSNFIPALAVYATNHIYCCTPEGIFKLLGQIPVELQNFNAEIIEKEVHLNWFTATETNNQGFEILRSDQNDNDYWNKIEFVPGHGTTTEPQYYSYVDESLHAGKYQYRLKQIDFDGSFEYSKIVEVTIEPPMEFSLSQNYPNPFNPSTKIKFTIPASDNPLLRGARGGLVTLKVYDVLGNEIATLVNEELSPGEYEVEFSGHSDEGQNLPSGVYFYQLRTKGPETSSGQGIIQTKKMILLK
jgi:hypothetical protein